MGFFSLGGSFMHHSSSASTTSAIFSLQQNKNGKHTKVRPIFCSFREVKQTENQDQKNNTISFKRRVLLLLGASTVPFLQSTWVVPDLIVPPSVCAATFARGHTSDLLEVVSFRSHVRPKRLEQPEMIQSPPVDEPRSTGNGLESSIDSQIDEVKKSSLHEVQKDLLEPKKMDPLEEIIGEHEPKIEDLHDLTIPAVNPESIKEIGVQEQPNQLIGILNEAGITVAGVLGALYALAKKEKSSMESMLESMEMKLSEKQAAISLLEKNYEERLKVQQEDHSIQIEQLQEGNASLSNQLSVANDNSKNLLAQWKREVSLAQELKAQIEQLIVQTRQAEEDKEWLQVQLKDKQDSLSVTQEKINLLSLEVNDKDKILQSLESLVAEKTSKYNSLNSRYNEIIIEIAEANSQIESLREDLVRVQEDLLSRTPLLDELNEQLKNAIAERDKISKEISTLEKAHNDLKLSVKEKEQIDYELLLKHKKELDQLKEKFAFALGEVSDKNELIGELTKEKDYLRFCAEEQKENSERLTKELQIVQDTLAVSENKAADLSRQLHHMNVLFEELSSETARMRHDFSNERELLQKNLNDMKTSSLMLSDELAFVREAMKDKEEKLLTITEVLNSEMKTRENLTKELVNAYKKLESLDSDLKEERKLVASLNRELETIERQLSTEREERKDVERDLREASESLQEMSKNALLLSKEVGLANSRVSSVEGEKDVMVVSLMEYQKEAKESKENLEDAQQMVTILANERDNLQKKVQRFQEELTAAKGEILRLRREINASKLASGGAGLDNKHSSPPRSQSHVDIVDAVPLSPKKNWKGDIQSNE